VIRVLPPAMAAQSQEALEARFGLRLAAALDEQALDHDIQQRLRVAREQAVGRAAAARKLTAASTLALQVRNGQAVLGRSPWWVPVASLLPLLVLALGFFAVEWLDDSERVRAAAEIDSVLLADDLPPRAYADPGFTQFLKQGSQ
jgi:Protein of unknown function (DUF3619)